MIRLWLVEVSQRGFDKERRKVYTQLLERASNDDDDDDDDVDDDRREGAGDARSDAQTATPEERNTNTDGDGDEILCSPDGEEEKLVGHLPVQQQK